MTDQQAPAARDPKQFAEQPIHRAMGLELEATRPGFARVRMTTSAFTQGGIGGSVHGGLLAALVDITTLEAMWASLTPESGQPAGTADLNIAYLRPALGPTIWAEATVLRQGRLLAVTEVTITDAQERLCAKGRAIYAFRPKS